jgi:hypothetical protein
VAVCSGITGLAALFGPVLTGRRARCRRARRASGGIPPHASAGPGRTVAGGARPTLQVQRARPTVRMAGLSRSDRQYAGWQAAGVRMLVAGRWQAAWAACAATARQGRPRCRGTGQADPGSLRTPRGSGAGLSSSLQPLATAGAATASRRRIDPGGSFLNSGGATVCASLGQKWDGDRIVRVASSTARRRLPVVRRGRPGAWQPSGPGLGLRRTGRLRAASVAKGWVSACVGCGVLREAATVAHHPECCAEGVFPPLELEPLGLESVHATPQR